MNLPFKIASQYLFTDRFFSREGLIINSVFSLLILILMYFNIEWGVPFLIMQLLPFSFIKENKLYNWGVKLGLGLIMALSPMVLLYGIIGLLVFKIIKEVQLSKRPKIASILLTLIVSTLLFSSFWLGVMFYILSLFIQQLFIGKRNAVHVISRISVLGITVGTTALILVLSVFNGFEVLIIDLFDSFNPDIKITATKGKVFVPDSSQVAELYRLEEVEASLVNLMKRFYGHRAYVQSAGVKNDLEIDGFSISVCSELGVELDRHRVRSFDEMEQWGDDLSGFDLIVALSPASQRRALEMTRNFHITVEYWPIIDPTGLGETREDKLAAFRQARDQIAGRIKARFGEPDNE